MIPLSDPPDPSAAGRWPLTRSLRVADGVAVGPPPEGWRAVMAAPLFVLVGLTGAGKTTLADALVAAGLAAALPDRRRLTDAVILGERAGRLDRAGRFAATAAFRKAAPGGMGEILAALSVAAPPERPFLFDGLRGAAELACFARQAPAARFLALSASDGTRAQRIAGRGDRFDGDAAGDAAQARALVARESTHYSFDAALDALRTHASGRFHALDAERLGPGQILAKASAIIRAAGG